MQLYIYFISSYAKAGSRVDRQQRGATAWVVTFLLISPTGKRQQLFFTSKAELSTVCEMLRAWRDNFRTSLNALIPAKVVEAAEAYNILEGLNVLLSAVVRDYSTNTQGSDG